MKRYLTEYTIPTHWKPLIDHGRNRNGRSYIKSMMPGKPVEKSIPLWIILRRLYRESRSTYPVNKMVKKEKQNILINGKRPVDQRTPVMTLDHLTIGGELYRFELYRSKNSPITYRLVKVTDVQKLIVRKDQFMGEDRVSFLNGQRIHVDVTNVLPGSIWTSHGIQPPSKAKWIVRLTGKNKFVYCKVMECTVDPVTAITKYVIDMEGRLEDIELSWQTLSKRSLGIIL